MAQSKHPKGLPFLFFSEMWERFGYYLIIGIFTQYLEAPENKGGWGYTTEISADIYGTFIALVFLTPFIGGLLADRLLGYRLSITLGGLMMGAGYCLLAVKGVTVFYLALFLIIAGNGFFKPNISTLLGNLYDDDRYIEKKDAGYNIFYMGINIGALICNFFAAALRNNYGWAAAFICAGIGMFLGVIIFWSGMKHYKHADVRKPLKQGDMPLGNILGITLLPAILAGILGWKIPGNIFGSDSTDAFIFGAIPVVGYYVLIWLRAKAQEKAAIGTMLAIFGVVIIFWAVFKQNGTALTTWAKNYTDREIPAAVAAPFESLSLAEKIEYKKDSVEKMNSQFVKEKVRNEAGEVVKNKDGKALIRKEYNYPNYFKNVPPEKRPQEGATVKVFNTELSQSINPFWVVVLTPVVVAFFMMLRRRGKEPTTPSKIAWGLIISALSTLVMVLAVHYCHNGEVKASPLWLVASYGVITIGELCLSPMGLSLVSRMSPPRLTALMMGGWFVATSLGNKLSGILASMWDSYPDKQNFFLFNFMLLAAAAVIILLMLRRLNRVFRTYTKD